MKQSTFARTGLARDRLKLFIVNLINFLFRISKRRWALSVYVTMTEVMYLIPTHKTYLTSWVVVSIRWLVGAWLFLPTRTATDLGKSAGSVCRRRRPSSPRGSGPDLRSRRREAGSPQTSRWLCTWDNRQQVATFLSSGISQFCTTLHKIQ